MRVKIAVLGIPTWHSRIPTPGRGSAIGKYDITGEGIRKCYTQATDLTDFKIII